MDPLKLDLAKGILIKEEGFVRFYGARPLRQAIMNLLKNKLAELFLTEILNQEIMLMLLHQIIE